MYVYVVCCVLCVVVGQAKAMAGVDGAGGSKDAAKDEEALRRKAASKKKKKKKKRKMMMARLSFADGDGDEDGGDSDGAPDAKVGW